MIALRIIKAIWNTCTIIASVLIGPALPVIGFSGNLVITHNIMKTAVPPMPAEYHVLPHCLKIGTIQNICAKPPTKNKISELPISSPLLIVSITLLRCNKPAINVPAAAAARNIFNFFHLLQKWINYIKDSQILYF